MTPRESGKTGETGENRRISLASHFTATREQTRFDAPFARSWRLYSWSPRARVSAGVSRPGSAAAGLVLSGACGTGLAAGVLRPGERHFGECDLLFQVRKELACPPSFLPVLSDS
jgi:hypothetical protein